jgi:hypothetical protein
MKEIIVKLHFDLNDKYIVFYTLVSQSFDYKIRKIAPNRTRKDICSFDRLRGISKQIYLSFDKKMKI